MTTRLKYTIDNRDLTCTWLQTEAGIVDVDPFELLQNALENANFQGQLGDFMKEYFESFTYDDDKVPNCAPFLIEILEGMVRHYKATSGG